MIFTEKQFYRCIWLTLGLQLNQEEASALKAKYGMIANGTERINYKRFCESIDKGFNPKDLLQDPSSQRQAAPEL